MAVGSKFEVVQPKMPHPLSITFMANHNCKLVYLCNFLQVDSLLQRNIVLIILNTTMSERAVALSIQG